MQFVLTAVGMGAAIYSLFMAGEGVAVLGCGIASLVVSVVSLGLQVKVFLIDSSMSGGYRTLQSQN